MLQTARPFISACPKMRQLDNIIHKAAQSTAPVLIIGETGSGKERVAQRLHYESKRKKNNNNNAKLLL